MKTARTLQSVAALALSFIAASSYGSSYDYSFTFNSGLVVSGTLDGDANGDFVENVSNVTVFFNGFPMSGTPTNPAPIIYTAKLVDYSFVAGPIVSFDVNQNNFVFANSDFAAGDFSYTSFFEFSGSAYAYAIDVDLSLGDFEYTHAQTRWSLTPSTVKVPDAGTMLPLLGVVLVSLGWFSRRRAVWA